MSAETMMKQIAAESRAGAKATLTSGACTEATGPHVSLDQYDTVIAATTNEELNKRDIFGDGDQSFLQHRGPQDVNAQALKNMWVAGGDFLMLANAGRLGAFMLNCFRGKHEQVANSLAKAGAAGGEAMYQLLARRETLLRWTPLDGAIYGALQMGNHDGAKHAKVAKLLLEAGANADAKDVCGSTPLLRCTTCAATEILLDIGMLLIDRGANANSRNRFGETALMEAVSSNCTDCVMLLCEGGADPMIASTDDAERCPFKNPLLALPTRFQVSEVLGHAISRKSVTGSWQLTGKQVTLHGLSRKDLNGKKGICGRLNPIKLRYAIQIMDDDGQEEQVMLIQIKNIRVTKTSLQGQRVILKGLGNEAMNGRQGLAGEFHEKRERWAVTLDGDTVSIAVKQTNLEMIPHVYTCEHCGVKAPKMSKCKKCFKTYFCSSACIKTGFDAHKAQCLGWREGQVTVDPRTCGPPEAYDDKYILKHGADLAQNSGQLRVPLLNRSKTIIVKVQTPEPMPNFYGLGFNLLHEAGLAGHDKLMVYNETRDVYLIISSKKCEQYAAIVKSVSDKGIVGRKAYFPARIAPGGKITINYLEHLAPQNW